MFTGIIEAQGQVAAIDRRGTDITLTIASDTLDFSDVNIGDSIAVNGVCLTVVKLGDASFSADVSGETLDCTTFSDLKPGATVNLEKALTLSARLGGHLVSGHVDGIGEVESIQDEGRSLRFRFVAPPSLAKYIAVKGSICIEGVSLTVNAVDGRAFEVNIVPHTLAQTTMKDFKSGTRVNLEVDLIARYLERLMQGEGGSAGEGGITLELLQQAGYIQK